MDHSGGFWRKISARVGAPLLLAYATGPISFFFLWGLRTVGLVAQLPLWVYGAVWLGPTMASTATNFICARRPTGTAVQARALTDAVATTVMIYATGWGPALGVTYIVAAQQLVAARGPRAWRVSRMWAFVGIGAGQLAIALGWAPSFLTLHLANGVAAVGGLAFIFVSRMAETISADRDKAWDQVQLSEARLSSLVQSSSDLIAVLDPAGTAIYVSGASERILGLTPEQFMAVELSSLVHPDDVAPVRSYLSEALTRPGPTNPVALRVRHRSGEWRHLEAIGTNLNDDPAVGGVVLNIRDVTERKRVETELAHQSAHDALTGLPNRVLFLRRLEESLVRSSHSGTGPIVLFLDVDRFKLVNDTLGHDAGDQLLVEAAHRLRGAVRSADLVARFGGDEFVILCEGPTDAMRVAQRVLEAFQVPFHLDGTDYQLSASVGVAYGGAPGNSAGEVVRDADTAMYRAKELGRGRIAVFDEDARALALQRVHIEHELRRAIERDELRLVYQPIVDIGSGRVVAAEALLRWQHPSRGLLAPGEFLTSAEDSGLIVPIGEWVLRTAWQQACAWRRAGRAIRMAVNISARQLAEDSISTLIRDVVGGGTNARDLVIELTESLLVLDPPGAAERLRIIRSLGIGLAIDDFGTGYSSLANLRKFPFDTIKIDRQFVAGMIEVPNDRTMVGAIIELAHKLGLTVVAEGVETAEQLTALRELGCDLCQGYFLGLPGPPEDIDTMDESSLIISGRRA